MLDFNIDNLKFEIDDDVKKEYLRQKPIQTAKGEYPTFVSLDEYEALLNKPVYNFSLSERDALMAIKFKNTTINSVASTVSKIKGYIDFCVIQGKVNHMQNIFDTLTKDEAKRFVSKQATEFRYITKRELWKYEEILYNTQDKTLINLLYEGVRGRTVKGGTLEEIINLQINPKSEDIYKCKLLLNRNDGTIRVHYVSQHTMDLVIDAYYSEEYLANNGEINPDVRGGIRKFRINRCGNYVFCTIGKNKCDKWNEQVINTRMKKIQHYCSNPFITVTNLYKSGMISMAIDIYKKNKEITRDDYVDICRRYRYGDEDPERYWSLLKQDVEMYLKGGYANAGIIN
ncbi:MAG TPA: hypothetical protein GX745_02935 [Clostridiales bacterium]|nr:hypothetical protein [Clostridiales bacterium]